MPTLAQFASRLKMRHDYSDMIQVRYTHPAGEVIDTWISGDEVMARLKSTSREELIRSFGRLDWPEAKAGVAREWEQGQQKAKRSLRERLAGQVEETLGDNLFGQTVADRVRGADGTTDKAAQEKALWQARLAERPFRAIAIELAWINLEGTLPEETPPEPDDWL